MQWFLLTILDGILDDIVDHIRQMGLVALDSGRWAHRGVLINCPSSLGDA
jgi:hypothetical protein